jgi:ATP-dependent exoDNAse (exonuclease V) alpha subunit
VEQDREKQLNQLRQPAAVSNQVKDQPSTRQVLLAATEHDAIITDAHITREAYRLSICKSGTAQASQLAKMARREAVRVVRVKGERDVSKRYALAKYTTRDLMKAERDILRTSIARQSESRHVVDAKTINAALERTAQAKGYELNAEQKAAVHYLCGTPGATKILVGDAGTGKSTTLYAVREACEGAGFRVLGTSTGGKASAELMASSGIESRNLARLLTDLRHGREQLDAKTLIVMDEAGMTGSRDFAALKRAIDDAGGKIIPTGDWKQIQPVGAGEMFRALDKELGSARLENINRQSNEWERQAIKELSRGEAAQALKAYDERGRIHIDATFEKAMKDVASRHVANMREVGADKAVALAGTNQAVDRINAEVREQLGKAGQLQNAEKFQTQDSNRNSGTRELELAKGDRVMIATTDTAKGYTNGDAGRVVGMDAKAGSISVKLDRTGETVQVKTQEAEVRHGYAMTTHKAQGSTYDRATVYLDSNSSREMAYVQASRAKEETHFVATSHTVKEMRQDTPAPEALQKAVEATAAARVAAGREAGLEPDTKANMQAAIEYIKANKDFAPAEAKREAKQAQTMQGLSEAMSRSRPKETTLDYAERPRPNRDGPDNSNNRQQDKEDRFKAQLDKVEKALQSERGKDKGQQQDTGRERSERIYKAPDERRDLARER